VGPKHPGTQWVRVNRGTQWVQLVQKHPGTQWVKGSGETGEIPGEFSGKGHPVGQGYRVSASWRRFHLSRTREPLFNYDFERALILGNP